MKLERILELAQNTQFFRHGKPVITREELIELEELRNALDEAGVLVEGAQLHEDAGLIYADSDTEIL